MSDIPAPVHLADGAETSVLPVAETSALPVTPGNPPARLGPLVLLAAVGVATVCGAFALARIHNPAAEFLFWSGQVVMLVAIAVPLLNGSASVRVCTVLPLLYAFGQDIVRWSFSPGSFRFSDELQHMRGALDVIRTGHLFQFNLSLPVSTYYPGLEAVATELTRLFGLSVVGAGVLLATVSHVLLTGCLMLLFREVTGSPRIAALAALLYLLNPNARFFDTSFVYETMALPFVILLLVLAIRIARHRRHRVRSVFGWLACTLVLTVTHHLSTVAAAGLMMVLGVLCLIWPDVRRVGYTLIGGGVVAIGVLVAWVLVAAPMTLDYANGYVGQILGGVDSLFGGKQGTAKALLSFAPLSDRALTGLGILLTVGLLIFSAWRTLRSTNHLLRAFVILALAYGGILMLRVAISEGAELSARILTFISIATAVSMAVAITDLIELRGRWLPPQPWRTPAATVALLILLASQIATGVPSYWERLPGTFHVAGGPGSGIDQPNLEAAEWAARNLPPRSRFFGNITAITVYSTYANLDPLRDPKNIFYSTGFDKADADLVKASNADYLIVDLKMSRDTPITGRYFTQDILVNQHDQPIPLGALTKFDAIPGIAKVYDSGDVKIYDLRKSAYYAP